MEIVVVNDGSTDHTVSIINKYLNDIPTQTVSYASNYNEATGEVERTYHHRYPQSGRELIVIHHDHNQGLGAALNTGFRACTGEYCTYIASDDMLCPTMVSDLLRVLEEEGADFVYADMHIIDDQGRILRQFSLPDYSLTDCFCHWYLCGICKLYRRKLHDLWGYYREDLLAHDHELYLRFAMNGARFRHVNKVLAGVRYHGPERARDNHAPRQWQRLLAESKHLVVQARSFMGWNNGTPPHHFDR